MLNKDSEREIKIEEWKSERDTPMAQRILFDKMKLKRTEIN